MDNLEIKPDEMFCAYTLEIRRIPDHSFPFRGKRFRDFQEMYEFCRWIEYSDIENLVCLFLDTSGYLVCALRYKGSVDEVRAYPREICKHAILSGASKVFIAHNHIPPELLLPQKDLVWTRNIKKTFDLFSIELIDHIVISDGDFASFNKQEESEKNKHKKKE